jgi:hypothetical protein
VLHVTRSIWHGREQDPKTPAAIREVDIAEPLAEMLRAVAEGKDGYLFSTRSGRPLGYRNLNRAAGVGLHALRRFGIETLRRTGVPEDLIGLWPWSRATHNHRPLRGRIEARPGLEA